MRKIEKRARFCLIFAGLLLFGLCVFSFRFVADGDDWASYPANRHLYNKQGVLIRGTIYDRNGEYLSGVSNGERAYNESAAIRKSTLHAVGDREGNIGTGALTAFADQLSGYNVVTGAYSTSETGNKLYLTIDSKINAAAYEALDGRRGTVGVYNYKTGEILCMVSTPTYDPIDPPGDLTSDPAYEGAYVNRFLSAAFTPGSVFKTVTLAAAIDNVGTLFDREYSCTGSFTIGSEAITCPSEHGTMDIGEAFANSCNCVFGELTTEIGPEKMAEYVKHDGLTSSISVSGIQTAKGSCTFPTGQPLNLAWAGIGQYQDLVNPCNLMVYMGAIANSGQAVQPQLIHQTTTDGGIPTSIYIKKTGSRALSAATAGKVAEMMRNNVLTIYGEDRFPDMQLCAKSGTAEVGSDSAPNAWFCGFLQNPDHPYAFVVMVENGGGGNKVAGTVAGKVLRTACEQE